MKDYARQILTALDIIHTRNIIHADLKPANLLLHRPTPEEKAQGKKPIIKLCDFGISQVANPQEFGGLQKAMMKERSGTAGYIAPEIKANNKVVGPEIDIWSFGVILYEMCVAYKPT